MTQPPKESSAPPHAAPEAARALCGLLLDHALATPGEVLLPPAHLARQAVALGRGLDERALRRSLEESFLRHRHALGELVKEERSAPLRSLLPPEAEAPLAGLAAEFQMPERETLRSLLDHPAMRDILRAVLLDTLTRFTSRVGSILGEASRLPGSGRLSGVLGVAKGVGKGLIEELSRKLEGRAGPFVDEALSRAVQVGLDAMTDPGREAELKEWRRSAVGAILDLPLHHLQTEAGRVDPGAMASLLTELIVALAGWDQAEERLAELLRTSGGDRWSLPLGELLVAEGIDEASWRPELEAHLAGRLQDFLGTEGFGAWLGQHGAGPDAP